MSKQNLKSTIIRIDKINQYLLKNFRYLLCLFIIVSCFKAFAQSDTVRSAAITRDGQEGVAVDSTKQRDVIDFLNKLLNHKSPETRAEAHKLIISFVPAVGYSLSTGFAVDLSGNVAFYTSKSHQENLSALYAEAIYDTKGQKIFISRGETWADKNNFKLVNDIRLERFPDDTYGIGTGTSTATDDPIVFSYIRTYVTVFKKVIPNYNIGLGIIWIAILISAKRATPTAASLILINMVSIAAQLRPVIPLTCCTIAAVT